MKKIKLVVICLLLVAAIGAAIYVMPPIITGSTKFLIVLSGSMSPIMNTGDLVVVTLVDQRSINVGDIIAYTPPKVKNDNVIIYYTPLVKDDNVIITHRVVEIIKEDDEGDLSFRTKGDANEDVDIYTVDATDLVGKATFVLPFLGYFFHYVRENKLFLLLLVIAPAMLIIMDEVRKIMIQSNPVLARKAIKEEKRRKERKKRIKVDYKKFLAIFLILSIPFLIISVPSLAMSGNVDVVDQTFLKFEKQEIKNEGLVPCVLVFDSDEKIVSYTVLPRGNATEIEIGAETESETSTSISSAPYIMPVFWIVQLASVNPFLPALVISLLPAFIISLIFYPVWLKDIRKRRKRKERRKRLR